MHGEGDLLMHLTTMGYKLNYQQVYGFISISYYCAEQSAIVEVDKSFFQEIV